MSNETVMAGIINGEVEIDTHNAYGYKKIANTKLSKMLYPDAEEDGKYLKVKDGVSGIFTVPETGIYSVTSISYGYDTSYEDQSFYKKGDIISVTNNKIVTILKI